MRGSYMTVLGTTKMLLYVIVIRNFEFFSNLTSSSESYVHFLCCHLWRGIDAPHIVYIGELQLLESFMRRPVFCLKDISIGELILQYRSSRNFAAVPSLATNFKSSHTFLRSYYFIQLASSLVRAHTF